MKTKITVFTPTYNRADRIEKVCDWTEYVEDDDSIATVAGSKHNIVTNAVMSCPVQTEVLERYGLQRNGQYQELMQSDGGKFAVYLAEYFCPMDYSLKYTALTENAASIYHFATTWFASFERFKFLYWNKVRRNFRKHIKMLIEKKRIKSIKDTVNSIKDCICDNNEGWYNKITSSFVCPLPLLIEGEAA